MSVLEASGIILTKECEEISFLRNVKKIKTSCVLEDIIGTLGPQVVHVGGQKGNTRHCIVSVKDTSVGTNLECMSKSQL